MRKKFVMPGADALRALYPPMSETEKNAVSDTLRSLKDNTEEKPVMKKKLSMGLVLALILILLTCAALAVSGNVFGWFAENRNGSGDGELFKKLDETSTNANETQFVAAATDEPYPAVEFTLSQSYYDGENLYIAYSLKGAQNVFDYSWTPAQDELAQMEKVYVYGATQSQEQEQEGCLCFDDEEFVKRMVADAKQNGSAYCAQYASYLSDGLYVDGTDVYLDLEMSDDKILDDGTLIGVKQFARPLCDEARDKDELTLCAYLYRSATYHYFDGTNWYIRSGESTREPLKVTLERNAYNDVASFPYSVEFDTYTAHGTVTLSALTVRVEAEVTGKNAPLTSADTDKPGDLYDYIVSFDGVEPQPLSGQGWGLGEITSGFVLEYSLPAQKLTRVTLTPCYVALDANGERIYEPKPLEAVTVDLTSVSPTALPHAGE